MLETLPPELLVSIIECSSSRNRDLTSLCRVSKRIRALTIPILYESVITQISFDSDAPRRPNRLVLARCEGYFRHTRHIQVRAQLKGLSRGHCMPHDPFWQKDEFDKTLSAYVATVLGGCQQGWLRSFTLGSGIVSPRVDYPLPRGQPAEPCVSSLDHGRSLRGRPLGVGG